MKRVWKFIRRQWSKWSQPATERRGSRGDWRVHYPDDEEIGIVNARTVWMPHGDALNCQAIWGGTLEWRYDNDNVENK